MQTLRKQVGDDKRLKEEIAAMERAENGETSVPRGRLLIADQKAHLRKKDTKKRVRPANTDETLEEKKARALSPQEVSQLNEDIRKTKEQLKEAIERNKDIDRVVRNEALSPFNIVSIFDSNLTRCLHMSNTDLNDDLVIVKVYYFGVAENIIKRGFWMNGAHYVFFSASAGQIRTKKFVAIKESAYNACRNTLTCGLSEEKINAKGGININKYLAYLALCNSATTLWEDFPIDKTIVIEDFETDVPGLVDFIDERDYSITRREQIVPITHSDGCGMILPKLSKINFMVRAPWVKGLLASFPFDAFIREANEKDPTRNHGLIEDIYGVEHDVLKEDIQIIFTKSQFKLWKLFDNWEQYKRNFKKYGCTAGKCNEEPRFIEDCKFNYQMLQTLTDMTDEELNAICEKTNRKLRNMTSDRQTMLQVFGAAKDPAQMTAFQRCLSYYPELLQDPYCRETLRDLKNSIELRGIAGRLDVSGKYLFLIPDLYAACQHWFCGIETPNGLLRDGEVFCRVYKDEEEMDVLRSPHLYKEHCIRRNTYQENEAARRWFRTDGIYTSSFDLISKVLQFDNDGDKSLVCVDKTIINAAKRNCSDIVPLYYPMAKAGSAPISPNAMYDGMVHAWTGGNIGEISNMITKIWSSPAPDEDLVKLLCFENNFVIDYAKTLYKPTRPAEFEERIKTATKGKVPRFFLYAKDKALQQVADPSQCVTDRLIDKIQSYKFNFQKKQLGTLDYKMLMHNPDIEFGKKEDKLVKQYYKLASNIGNYNLSKLDEDNTYAQALREFKSALAKFGDEVYVTDVLVKQLFHIRRATHKSIFWDAYGEIVYENLKHNKAGDRAMCQRCGTRFVRLSPRQCLCSECTQSTTSVPEPPKVAVCIDCGKEFVPTSLSQTRCQVCQWMHDNPVVTDLLGVCVSCGAPFDMNKGRGRKKTMCKRCQDLHGKARHIRYNRKR